MESYVVGVDGCGGGWVACCYTGKGRPLKFKVFGTFIELVREHREAKCIAADIPIGLRDDWVARGCDREARRILDQRGSSVFPAPPRCLLGLATYSEAGQKSLEFFGRSLSRQTFHIMPKILEVDGFITPERQGQIFEVHPEVCFWAMAGHPMAFSKKSHDGYDERRNLLSKAFESEFPGIETWRGCWSLRGEDIGRDDVMDAAAAAWTALRRAQSNAVCIPAVVERNGRGLRMEIIY